MPIPGDLFSLRAVEEGPFDGVCHLAALVRVRDSRADPLRFWRTNVGGTLALLDALVPGRGAVRLVVASTCAVYGDDVAATGGRGRRADPGPPVRRRQTRRRPVVADLAATGAIGAVSLRAFNVAGGVAGHGDRDETRLIPKVVAVAHGRAAELAVNGDGSAVRDYLHVADMADAFVRALDTCRPGRWTAYNVGCGPGQPDRRGDRHGRGGGGAAAAGAVRAAGARARAAGGRCGPDPAGARVDGPAFGPAADRGGRVRGGGAIVRHG